MFIYESYTGRLFANKNDLSFEERYDEESGKCDQFIGEVDSAESCWNLLKSNININGSGGWSLDYIKEFIHSIFDVDDEDLNDWIKKEKEIRPQSEIDISNFT